MSEYQKKIVNPETLLLDTSYKILGIDYPLRVYYQIQRRPLDEPVEIGIQSILLELGHWYQIDVTKASDEEIDILIARIRESEK